MRAHHSRIDTVRKPPAISHQPPWFSGGSDRPYCGRRRLQRQPEQLAHELDDVPVDLGQHVEADDVEGQRCRRSATRCPAGPGRSARSAACRCGRAGAAAAGRCRCAGCGPAASGTPRLRRPDGLHLGEEILVFSHVVSPARSLHGPLRPDRQVQPPAPPLGPAAGPERAADDDAHGAEEHRRQRQEQAQAVDAQRADRVADGVAEEGVLVSAVFIASPFSGLLADRISPPCSDSASVVVKKKLMAIMCAGL